MFRSILSNSLFVAFGLLCTTATAESPTSRPALDIGSRLELLADGWIVDRMDRVSLQLQRPEPAGIALKFDRPYEGPEAAYVTVIHDDRIYRMYYRGIMTKDPMHPKGSDPEMTCYAESPDGLHWNKPDLGLGEINGSKQNNVLLANDRICHNFSPFLDTHPNVPGSQRYKAVGAAMDVGLIPLASADGVHWEKLSTTPVFTQGRFDSQNVVFWSEAEKMYICYFRTLRKVGGTDYRWISRTTSPDFLHWSDPVEMSMGDVPPEQYYTNQTRPYFRAPHLYVATPARFMQGRRVVPVAREKEIGVPAQYAGDCSDAIFMTTRGGDTYTRLFIEAFVRPGPGLDNWVSRTNYPAYGVVPTGPAEMSMYVQRHYTLQSHCLERLRLRTDGFVSAHAPYSGGELLTRPLRFAGNRLVINYATSAAGQVKVELQDDAGSPLPGFEMSACVPVIGDEIERIVSWKSGTDLSALAGKPVRIRFVMADADLYSLRFR